MENRPVPKDEVTATTDIERLVKKKTRCKRMSQSEKSELSVTNCVEEIDEKELKEKLKTIQQEFQKTQRKLQKSSRASAAKAHVRQKLKSIQQSVPASQSDPESRHNHKDVSGTDQENTFISSGDNKSDHHGNKHCQRTSPCTLDLSRKISQRRLSLGNVGKKRHLTGSPDCAGSPDYTVRVTRSERRRSLPLGSMAKSGRVGFNSLTPTTNSGKSSLSLSSSSDNVQKPYQVQTPAADESTENESATKLKCKNNFLEVTEHVSDTVDKTIGEENLVKLQQLPINDHLMPDEVNNIKQVSFGKEDDSVNLKNTAVSSSNEPAMKRSHFEKGTYLSKMCKYKSKRLVTRTTPSGSPVLMSSNQTTVACSKHLCQDVRRIGTSEVTITGTSGTFCKQKPSVDQDEGYIDDIKEAQVVVFSRRVPVAAPKGCSTRGNHLLEEAEPMGMHICPTPKREDNMHSKIVSESKNAEQKCQDLPPITVKRSKEENESASVHNNNMCIEGVDSLEGSLGICSSSETCTSMISLTESSIENGVDNADHDVNEPVRKLRGRKRRSTGERSQRLSSRVTRQSVSPSTCKKSIIISSLFHCLVDEAKRKKAFNEFSMPDDIVSKFNSENSGNVDSTDNGGVITQEPVQEGTDLTTCTDGDMALKLQAAPKVTASSEITDDESKDHSPDGQSADGVASMPGSPMEVFSPPLFESPRRADPDRDTDNDNLKNVLGLDSPECDDTDTKCLNKLPDADTRLGDEITSDKNHEHALKTQKDEIIEGSGEVCEEGKATDCFMEGENTQEGLCQLGSFQLQKPDVLVAMVICECGPDNSGSTSLYVACLCTSALKIYIQEDQQFNCVKIHKLHQQVRKNSGCQLYSLPGSWVMSLILQQTFSNCTSLSMCVYNGSDVSVREIDKLWARKVQVCVLDGGCLAVSYITYETTHLNRYTCTSSSIWVPKQLEPCRDQITSLVSVAGLPEAVVGVSSTGKIYIWNHNQGCLLCSVDIIDVIPTEAICPAAFSEQGYLFLPLLHKKKCRDGGGAVIVINPSLGTSETLSTLQLASGVFTGCSRAAMCSDDMVLARDNSGHILLWDVYSGHQLATLSDVTLASFTVSKQHVAVTHKQCVHIYTVVV